jgi:outer membrane cobalamin receptor
VAGTGQDRLAQVLVLLDGQPLVGARGIKRGAINLDRQSIGRLDRVEVVKGRLSPHGSDAIGASSIS